MYLAQLRGCHRTEALATVEDALYSVAAIPEKMSYATFLSNCPNEVAEALRRYAEGMPTDAPS